MPPPPRPTGPQHRPGDPPLRLTDLRVDAVSGPRDRVADLPPGLRDHTGEPLPGVRDHAGDPLPGVRDHAGELLPGPRDRAGEPPPGPPDHTGESPHSRAFAAAVPAVRELVALVAPPTCPSCRTALAATR